MSAWLDGPIAGPLVDGDLCEVSVPGSAFTAGVAGWRCDRDAAVIAETLTGEHFLLCAYHGDRHGLVTA